MTEVGDLGDMLPVALDGHPHGRGFTTGLGLTLVDLTPTKARATAEIGPEHHQEAGILHGGWHAAVVETVGSLGAHLKASEDGQTVVGVSNLTEFFRPVVDGALDVEAAPVHQGRTQQVWEVRITRPDGKLVARGQLRLANIDH
ncbi:MAG TPA: PaaI family thioesterase [Euzebyales bacterium]